jgi:hypothetical protein
MEIFYAFVLIEPEILSNSEFIPNTCLSFGKVFDNIVIYENEKRNIKKEIIWVDILRIYLYTQTILLKCLKYNFVQKFVF